MKLTLITGSQNQIFSYNKFPVVIGSDSYPNTTLSLPDLQPIHVRIIQVEEDFFAVNEVNDPFVSLNGIPFRKKKISDNDLLELTPQITIRFELKPVEVPAPVAPAPTPLILQKKQDPKPIKINELNDDEPIPPAPPIRGKVGGFSGESVGKNLKLTCTLLGMFLILLAFVGSALYTRMADDIEVEEMIAAEGVSDIAMALMYAQVHNLKPKKHNWSDPEFIKNNLAAVITHDCPSISNIDAHGEFSNCPYLLRTYTNGDFSHFIVIAQPNPSLLQWLIPKKTIVVDSNLMELHKVQDVRVLNRLLINANILDGPNSSDITTIVKAGSLISLATLATKREDSGFAPPKALGLMHPGAENKIYNAPRYHHFGESVVRRALMLGAYTENPSEQARLKQEMEALSRFPHPVLYSSQGMEMAMQTRRALAAIIPNQTFILGYLKYNINGKLVSSHLIMDQDIGPIAVADIKVNAPAVQSEEWINIQLILENAARKLEAAGEKSLQFRLKELLEERERAITPVTEKFIATLQESLKSGSSSQIKDLQPVLKEYCTTLQAEDEKLKQKIIVLYEEFQPLPFEKFLNAADQAGLISWMPNASRI